MQNACKEISDYLTYLKLSGLSGQTIRDRAYGLARFARAIDVPPVLATYDTIYAWRAGLRQSDEVVGNYVGFVRGFFDWATRVGLVPENPALGIPVPPGHKRLPRPIPEAALYDILESAPPRIRPWLILAGWVALRCKEIALMSAPCMSLPGPAPRIEVDADATKGHNARLLAVCQFAAEQLLACNLPRRGWSFLRHDGQDGPNSPALVSILANRHIHACGYDDTMHALRHRCLTELYRATKDIRLVQEYAGHASPDTTAVYTLVASVDTALAVARLPVPPRLRMAS